MHKPSSVGNVFLLPSIPQPPSKGHSSFAFFLAPTLHQRGNDKNSCKLPEVLSIKGYKNMEFRFANKVIVFVFLLFSLSSCGSVREDMKLKTFLECQMAAVNLGKKVAIMNISRKMTKYINENNIKDFARRIVFLRDEIKEDYRLYDMKLKGQLIIYSGIYNSSDCIDIHEQKKIEVPFMWKIAYFFRFLM